MGAYVVLYPRATDPYARVPRLLHHPRDCWSPAYFMLGYWFLLADWWGFFRARGGNSGGIAVGAHVGGFLAGVILIFFLQENGPGKGKAGDRDVGKGGVPIKPMLPGPNQGRP